MKFRPLATANVLLSGTLWACLSLTAQAEQVTPEGAKQLTDVLETYIGKPEAGTPSAVMVAPEGGLYHVNIDVAKIPLLVANKINVSGVIDYDLKPMPDGKWQLTKATPLSLHFQKNDFQADWSAGTIDESAVFDPKLRTFSESVYKMTKVDSLSKTSILKSSLEPSTKPADQNAPASMEMIAISSSNLLIGNSETTTRSRRSGDNMVDIDMNTDQKNYQQTEKSLLDPNSYAVVSLSEISSQTSYKGIRVPAIMDLWAFFIAHNSSASITNAQADLKQKLRDLGPVLNSMNGASTAKDLKIDTILGAFGVKTFNVKIVSTGLTQDFKLNTDIEVNGFTTPANVLPAWSIPLLPNDLTLHVEANGADMQTARTLFINSFDLKDSSFISDANGNKIMSAILPESGAHFVIRRSELRTPTATLTVEGNFEGKISALVGKGHIVAKNFDGIVDVLKKAPANDPVAGQAIMVLSSIKGFGKQGPDGTLVWDLQGDSTGKVTVNDIPIAK